MNIYKNPSSRLLDILKGNTSVGQSFFLISKGELLCTFNHTSHHISAPSLVALPASESISELTTGPDSQGYLIVFDQSLVSSFHLNVKSSEIWKRLSSIHSAPLTKRDVQAYRLYVDMMVDSLNDSDNVYGKDVLWLVAKAFLFKVQNLFETGFSSDSVSYDRKEQIVRDFMSLVHVHGSKHRDIQFYADKMCISPKYLSHVVSKVTGKKCLSWIEDFTINRARNMLKTSDLSISQISYELNFAAPSDFCRYFRARIGMSPKRYRLSGTE